jgi:hypothetical protein
MLDEKANSALQELPIRLVMETQRHKDHKDTKKGRNKEPFDAAFSLCLCDLCVFVFQSL